MPPPAAVIVALVLPALVAVAVCVVIAWALLRNARHQRTLRALYLEADGIERDLKACRLRLQRTHASMSLGPHQPAADELHARRAIDVALRDLLAHRLWLRDQAGHASQRELQSRAAAMGRARGALGQQLRALDCAQRALEAAVRENIEGLSQQP